MEQKAKAEKETSAWALSAISTLLQGGNSYAPVQNTSVHAPIVLNFSINRSPGEQSPLKTLSPPPKFYRGAAPSSPAGQPPKSMRVPTFYREGAPSPPKTIQSPKSTWFPTTSRLLSPVPNSISDGPSFLPSKMLPPLVLSQPSMSGSPIAKILEKLDKADVLKKPTPTIFVGGFYYTINGYFKNKAYYVCKHHRCNFNGEKCKARYHLDMATDQGKTVGPPHICNLCKTYGNVIEITEEMKSFIAENIYDYAGQAPRKAAIDIYNTFVEKYKGQTIGNPLTIQQIIGAVVRARSGEAQGDLKITMPPMSIVSSLDSRLYVQFDKKVNLQSHNENKYSRIIGFAHPQLIRLAAHGPLPGFIDGTFYICPSEFAQMLNILVYSKAHDMYVPMWRILITGGTEIMYRSAFHEVKMVHLRYQAPLELTTVTVDFETALMNAVKAEFNKEDVEGCLFHFVQAILRHLLRVIKFDMNLAMQLQDKVKILTVIPPDEIWSKGLPYILFIFKEEIAQNVYKWGLFADYMRHTWIVYYSPNDWNVHRFIDQPRSSEFNCKLTNKTNNPCESENSHCGAQITCEGGHPTLPRLMHVLKNRDIEMVQRLHRIDMEHEDKPGHPQPIYYKVPPEYRTFAPPESLQIGAKTFYFRVEPDAISQKKHHQHMLNRARRNLESDSAVPAVFVWPVPPAIMAIPPQAAVINVAHAQNPPILGPVSPVLAPAVDGAIPAPMPPSPGFEVPFLQFDPNDYSSDEEQQPPQPPPHDDAPLVDQNQVVPVIMKKLDQWIACDGCNKWRKVPADIDIKSLESGPWYCNMNTWDKKNHCRFKEEMFPVD